MPQNILKIGVGFVIGIIVVALLVQGLPILPGRYQIAQGNRGTVWRLDTWTGDIEAYTIEAGLKKPDVPDYIIYKIAD